MADIIVNSYTVASLPAAGTAGRIARVTDSVRGLWMDQGVQWFSLSGATIDVRNFGAVGNGVADDTAALQSALNAGPRRIVYIPPGNYRTTAPLTLPSNTTVRGAGLQASVISVAHNGNGLVSSYPVNTNNAAYVALADFAVICQNGTTTVGFGLYQLAGTYVYVDRLLVRNFTAQIAFDQTEIATIKECVFELLASQCRHCIWLINGPSVTAGSAMGLTNRISIKDCQFNSAVAASGAALIRDDGGLAHSIENCNFNGADYGLIACGVEALRFVGNEVEAQSQTGLLFGSTNFDGAYVGACAAMTVSGNVFVHAAPACISVGTAQGGEITDNVFHGYSTVAINLLTDAIVQLVVESNAKAVRQLNAAVGPFVGPASGAPSRLAAQVLRQRTQTFATSGAITPGARTITPATMGVVNTPEAIIVGSRLLCHNQDSGANPEYVIVTAVAASTFTATFATAKSANFLILGA